MIPLKMALKLRKSLIKHEGYSKKPYLDTTGHITIGIGYNLTDRGLDDDWINQQFEKDVEYFYSKLSDFHWFKELNHDRQIVLVDMAFMGWKTFLEFKKMLYYMSIGAYNLAAKEMLNSKWAMQVKGRAVRLAQGMETGVYEP